MAKMTLFVFRIRAVKYISRRRVFFLIVCLVFVAACVMYLNDTKRVYEQHLERQNIAKSITVYKSNHLYGHSLHHANEYFNNEKANVSERSIFNSINISTMSSPYMYWRDMNISTLYKLRQSNYRDFHPIISKYEYQFFIELFEVFITTCEINDIQYMLYRGSLIGAHRHAGMVPWGDDIDVLMNATEKYKLSILLRNITGFSVHAPNAPGVWKFYKQNATVIKSWQWPFIDIFFFQENETHIWDESIMSPQSGFYKRYNFCYRKQLVYPLQMVPFERLNALVPRCMETVLRSSYDVSNCVTASLMHRYELRTKSITAPCKHLHPFLPFVFLTQIDGLIRRTLQINEPLDCYTCTGLSSTSDCHHVGICPSDMLYRTNRLWASYKLYTGVYVTTGDCVDRVANCEALKDLVCADPSFKTQCAKTCGLCADNIVQTTTSTTTTTTHAPATTAPHWSEWSSWNCSVTTNTCLMARHRQCSGVSDCQGGRYYEISSCNETICPNDVCKDILNCSIPEAKTFMCGDNQYARQYCRHTCGKCLEPAISPTLNSCGDPAATVNNCRSLQQIGVCHQPDIRILCQNFCDGKCT